MNSEVFEIEAHKVVDAKLTELYQLGFREAHDLPAALVNDIVIARKEVQMTIFRQLGLPDFSEAVLITVQLARAGLGGVVNYHYERALVFSANGDIREATESELLATGG